MNLKPLYWAGVKSSDIKGVEHLFSGGITIIGDEADTAIPIYSIETDCGIRLNHNSIESNAIIDDFFLKIIKKIEKAHGFINIFFQDQLNFSQDSILVDRAAYNNDLGLLEMLCNKSLCRSVFSNHVPVLESTVIFKGEVDFENLKRRFPDCEQFVIQKLAGSGGSGTFLFSHSKQNSFFQRLDTTHVLVSKYLHDSIPANLHIVVFQDKTLLLPPSVQIISQNSGQRLLYSGADYYAAQFISKKACSAIKESAEIIGNILRMNGFRGCAGIDYLVVGEKAVMVEINPRMQSSTALLNQALIQQRIPSIQELHILSHNGECCPRIPKAKATGSMITHHKEEDSYLDFKPGTKTYVTPDKRKTIFSQDSIEVSVSLEGLKQNTEVRDGAHLGYFQFNRQIVSQLPGGGVVVNPALVNLGKRPPRLLLQAGKGDKEARARLKFHLLSQGARISKSALDQFSTTRSDLTIRDGIAGGLELRLCDNIHINVPVKEFFALISPFTLDWNDRKKVFCLRDLHRDSLDVEVLPIPDFVGRRTSRGTPMVEVGQMFNERLSLEIYFGCVNAATEGKACHFCELGAEPDQQHVDLDDMREVVEYCDSSPTINMRHVLIGGGTPPENLWHRYFDALEIIQSVTDKSTYMMIAPPADLLKLNKLHSLGLDEIGMNIELFDRDIAKEVMPVKGRIGLDYYIKALDHAVSLWGRDGAVRSIMIVGLEPLESTLKGVELLSSHGVLPILSPYRPIPNTPLANHPPPSPEQLYEVWTRGEKIARRHGLFLGPHCIACQNNTIAMPFASSCRYY